MYGTILVFVNGNANVFIHTLPFVANVLDRAVERHNLVTYLGQFLSHAEHDGDRHLGHHQRVANEPLQ